MRVGTKILLLLLSVMLIKTGKSQEIHDSTTGRHATHDVYGATDSRFSAVNLKNIDTLSLWNYQLDTPFVSGFRDSIKPVGHISFWRIKPFAADLEKNKNTRAVPFIDFEIFDIRDSSFCDQQSRKIMFITNCVPPNVGGDLFAIGHYIFLNRWACVSCGSQSEPLRDYCRPVINFIFSRFSGNERSSLADIVRQFPIKAGKI